MTIMIIMNHDHTDDHDYYDYHDELNYHDDLVEVDLHDLVVLLFLQGLPLHHSSQGLESKSANLNKETL